jgi:hypothetical protein
MKTPLKKSKKAAKKPVKTRKSVKKPTIKPRKPVKKTMRYKKPAKKTNKKKISLKPLKNNDAERLFILYTEWCLHYHEDRQGYSLCYKDSLERAENIYEIPEAENFIKDINEIMLKYNLRDSYPHTQAFYNLKFILENRIREIEKNRRIAEQFKREGGMEGGMEEDD